ncbi:MAG: ArsR family transcriptional regulator, partial [Halobacteriota archaeon]
MHPQSENIDGPGGGQERLSTQPGRDGFNAWRALQKATDKKRANLIADIVGHPKGKPSVEELDYMNPSLSEDAIRRHLSTLQEVGVVEEVELEVGERLREYPYKFYGLTDDARDLFDQSDLFPEEPWQRQYESVEKT